MVRSILLALSIAVSIASLSQKNPLINSGDVIEKANELYDSGQYKRAIDKLLTISSRDTNYVLMLTELASSYLADEQYEKAIETSVKALEKPSVYRARLLRLQAMAAGRMDSVDIDKAISLFSKALEDYPFDYISRYLMGLVYYDHGDYDKASECFFNVLTINPFHAGSHYYLGKLSIGRGRKTHAMLSLGMYLGINNQDNERLVLIDRFLSNQVPDEGTLTASDPNACEKLDQIIRAKIAMDKNFKTLVDVEAPVVRQFEMFFEQLASIQTDKNDRWVEFYLPIYQTIKTQNMVEPFIYHILASASNNDVKKWRSKNEKTLRTFYDVVNTTLKKKREVITAPKRLGFSGPVQAWYNSSNSIEALGSVEGDNRQGRWIYFHDNGEMAAEGDFINSEKKGAWKYYYNDGSVKSIEDYETGEITIYFLQGDKHQHFFLKDDKIHGDVTIYHPCGGVKEKLVYNNGKREGFAEKRYPSGKPDETFTYKDGMAEGESLSYYENGILFSKTNYKAGKLHGTYREYYANGNLRTQGEYLDDQLHGIWKHYYVNKMLERTGEYKGGLPLGEWKYYDKHGKLTEIRTFNDKGEWHGDNTIYEDEAIHYVRTFKNDMLIKLAFYKEGKELAQFGSNDGNFTAKSFYSTGQLSAEGAYKKGKRHGLWKFYFREGGLSAEYTYDAGLAQGEAVDYFRNGQKKHTMTYKDDELHGYFQEFFIHGPVKTEGWYQDGKRQQQWMDYYPDGTLQADYYYLNDNYHGEYNYYSDGKLYSTTLYGKEGIEHIWNYNAKGAITTQEKTDNGRRIYETRYKDNQLKTKLVTHCGSYTETVERWFPGGKTFYSYPMMNGSRHGAYRYYYINGQLETEGTYNRGWKEGLWQGYHANGKVSYSGRYIQDKNDSTWTYYSPDGKVSSTSEYREDERHGITRFYSPYGAILIEKQYRQGDLIAFRVAGAGGTLGEWIPFTGNESISVKYPDGTKAFEETYKNGLLHGTRRLYFSNGKLYAEYPLANGDYEGPFVQYYLNGNVFRKGAYKNDEFHGKVATYHENGSLAMEEEYTFGSRNGSTVLYKNGIKVTEYTCWNDMVEE